jgi:hypothetical protein
MGQSSWEKLAPMYRRNNRVAVLALLLGLHVPLAPASVYRCVDEQDVVIFSQYPCATASNPQTIVITNISVVAAAPLTKSEQAILERLQRQYHRTKTDNLKDQQRARQRTEQRRTSTSHFAHGPAIPSNACANAAVVATVCPRPALWMPNRQI